MVPKHIKNRSDDHFINQAFELVKWSQSTSSFVLDNVFAVQTTRSYPLPSPNNPLSGKLTNQPPYHSPPYGNFNLGTHVGDDIEQVKHNRNTLNQYIGLKSVSTQSASDLQQTKDVKIQWLEQVHGNNVTLVTKVTENSLVADASITRDKHIALAIMTADCLPILLSHDNGQEIAAIHGGWRSLASGIIAKTIEKMQSKPSRILAWLGPCIGPHSFEVGSEVKHEFIEQNKLFEKAFVQQANGKYLANLHTIAKLQLLSLGITSISSLNECTYQKSDKYYSYRKENTTGRMATVICRR